MRARRVKRVWSDQYEEFGDEGWEWEVEKNRCRGPEDNAKIGSTENAVDGEREQ